MTKQNEFEMFIVLIHTESKWNDNKELHYEYASNLPCGKLIKPGDLLFLAQSKKDSRKEKQIYGYTYVANVIIVGESDRIQRKHAIFSKIIKLKNRLDYSDLIISTGINTFNSMKKIHSKDFINAFKLITQND